MSKFKAWVAKLGDGWLSSVDERLSTEDEFGGGWLRATGFDSRHSLKIQNG